MKIDIQYGGSTLTVVGTYEPAQRGDLETEALREWFEIDEISIGEVRVMGLLYKALTETCGNQALDQFGCDIVGLVLKAMKERGQD